MAKNRKARSFQKSNNVAQPQRNRSLEDILALEQHIQAEKSIYLQKALTGTDASSLIKAKNYLSTIEQKQDVPIKSILVDPMDVASSFGYKDKPYQLSYDMLRAMSKTHIFKAYIVTRKAQISKFCEPQSDKYKEGFVIEKRDRWRSSQKDKPLTADEQKRAEKITQFILNCGNTNNYWNADTFERFMAKTTDDSLTLDQETWEVVRDRIGRPIEFFATDAATYRIADTYGEYGGNDAEEIKGYKPSYVQVYNGKVLSEFYPWELCFGVRNPTTDIRTNGYGKAELEDLIAVITSLLNADAYNANFFKVGSSPQGILSYSGNINQNTLNDFRQQWQSMVAGVANSHKIPLINADKINFIPTHIPNKDMEYGRFQEFLIKVLSAVCLIDPSEMGFSMSGNTEGNSGLGGDATKEKLSYSRDKGLKPLLKNKQYLLNKYIVWQLDPEFELRFVGVDDIDDKNTELDQDVKKVANFMTMNEIRAKYNLDPLPNGDIVLNPIAAQQAMMAMQGDPESNNAVDGMQEDDENENPDQNPFMKSLQTDLSKLLS